MSTRGQPSTHLYLELFLGDGPETVGALIDAIRSRGQRIVQEWHDLYSSQFGAHRAIPERLFQETYGPTLRTAVTRIVRGDMTGFVTVAASLGEQMAGTGLPFAALVSHLHLWKESCAKALADDLARLCSSLILLDKLSSAFVSAAAEGYYGGVDIPPPPPRGRDEENPTGERPPTAAPAAAFHGLVGGSAAIRQVFDQIRLVAHGCGPVLILGETGTGKERVAQAIHREGPRRDRPFIGVNCAALPRELIESELFGYKRGAFSGAVSDHLGVFRAASGGTLLLDEVTEMSSDLQAKLLRVLQERAVRPLGAVSEIPVDVRIIASTNRDPTTALGTGLLRSDLYYRLCGTAIVLPPLRERRDDIVPLVEHHITVLNARYGRSGPQWRHVTPAAMQMLSARPWFGNVRELFNVLEGAFTSSASAHIGPADIVTTAPASAPLPGGMQPGAALETFAESERALIERALLSTGGNKLLAARRLGISRKKLYAKIAKYDLSVGVETKPN